MKVLMRRLLLVGAGVVICSSLGQGQALPADIKVKAEAKINEPQGLG
jgi:hypothetical protein